MDLENTKFVNRESYYGHALSTAELTSTCLDKDFIDLSISLGVGMVSTYIFSTLSTFLLVH